MSENFSPIACAALVLMVYLIWSLPRQYAVCPLLIMACLMPLGQQLDLLGLHFFFFRVLLLVGCLRIIIKGEAKRLTWARTDKFFLWWVVVSVVFGTMAKPSMDLFVNRMGDAYNALAGYFFVRCVVVDLDDIWISVRTLAWLSMFVAVLMFVERFFNYNPVSLYTGVPIESAIREGHVRSQGAFRHAILAGTFGATQFPLFVALWIDKSRRRWLAIMGIIASLVIVGTAGSSGGIMALAGAIFGIFFWKWRAYTQLLRRATVVLIIALALTMKVPVWYLIAKASDLVGGGGWHRAYLIDQAVNHFDEWWLFGTTYTAHWGPGGEVIAADPNMMDITNQYIWEGVKGGVVKLILFLIIIVLCFKGIGRQLRVEGQNPQDAFLLWALGVSLFTHCVAFFSIQYFDQMVIIWYWLLAIITGAACIRTEPASSIEAASAFEVRPG
jgi:hypothetical protein